jgi:hypothetical protein
VPNRKKKAYPLTKWVEAIVRWDPHEDAERRRTRLL